MTTIRIREQRKEANSFAATVIFDDQGEYAITVSDPFSPEEEARLEWYFEQHLKFPFMNDFKAREAAASIATYGEALFGQVFSGDAKTQFDIALQTEILAGPIGAEFAVVIDGIAKRQLLLKRYAEAEASYQQALAVLGQQQALTQEAKEKGRARILHQLGMVAEEQRQWESAAQYYQQALAIKVEFNDRYRQASTLGQLGLLAEAQEQFRPACDYLLQALTIFVEYEDNHSAGITLQNLARLWKSSSDTTLSAMMAEALQVTVEQVEELLRKMLGEKE